VAGRGQGFWRRFLACQTRVEREGELVLRVAPETEETEDHKAKFRRAFGKLDLTPKMAFVMELEKSVVTRQPIPIKGDEIEQQYRRDFNELPMDKKVLAIAELEGSEMFKKALATYEGLKPAASASMLLQLMRPGGGTGALDNAGADQAVAYLNAMEDRTRTKIIAEFQKQDPALAAELLERLRTRATLAAGPGIAGR